MEANPIENQQSRLQYILHNIWSWLIFNVDGKFLVDRRNNLSVVASIIAAMTFQVIINPPESVRPVKDTVEDIPCTPSSNVTYQLCPGEAVFAIVYADHFIIISITNTVCFISSLPVCLQLVFKVSVKHRVSVWVLSTGMNITASTLAIDYINVLSMIIPKYVWI